LQALKEGLLSLLQERLPTGVVADREHAWMSLSSALPAAESFEVRPLWSGEASEAALPFTFEVRPKVRVRPHTSEHGSDAGALRVTLGVPLQREVWVSTRRLRKGSMVTCGDLQTQLRALQRLPKSPLLGPCAAGEGVVAQRDIASGAVMRSDDLGSALAVRAGSVVRVNTESHGITVGTTAIALSDGRVGDRIDVRLSHPWRILNTRVIAPDLVQVGGEST
jgi:flagella basal body P-ring formation protein FlgA